MKVSEIAAAEFGRALEVWEASVRATHDFVSAADIEFFRPMVLAEFGQIQHLAGLRDDDDRLVGFVGVADAKVEMLFLDPEVRGQGGGKLLLDHAVRVFGGTSLDVNEQNQQAVGFYLHQGFRITGRSPLDGLGKPYPLLHLALP
ncbi:GNAT family N-acetyltransferase [Kribbella monticola]|uniref:GNAT family N-acetyltransferase n=1 Tax=Kribbella monticola TaxID=2185285 RepID=UPI0018E59B91|nr:GNAT family N-acetyltransferase [Kribbella monticola]